jgi:hypothetical protein
MEKIRPVNKEELVDSIMAITLQCGLTVEKIQIAQGNVLVIIKDGTDASFDLEEAWRWTLEELRDSIEKQVHV